MEAVQMVQEEIHFADTRRLAKVHRRLDNGFRNTLSNWFKMRIHLSRAFNHNCSFLNFYKADYISCQSWFYIPTTFAKDTRYMHVTYSQFPTSKLSIRKHMRNIKAVTIQKIQSRKNIRCRSLGSRRAVGVEPTGACLMSHSTC